MITTKGARQLSFFAAIVFLVVLPPPFLSCLATLPITSHTTRNTTTSNTTSPQYHRTRNINPVFCHTLTKEACRRLDELEGEQSRRNRLFLTARGRRQLQQEQSQQQSRRNFQENAGHPYRAGVSSTSGTLNILVCLLIWSDHVDQRELPPKSTYEEVFNGEGTSDLIPSGSVKKWFETSSYGEFSIQATVVDWLATDNTEAFFSFPNRGRSDEIIPAFTPVLQSMEDSGFDFSPFDSDGDGVLDLVVFVHSGYDGLQDGNDQFGVAADFRVAAHARSGCSSDTCWTSTDGSFRLGPYAMASGYLGLLNFETARIGVFCHEMIHCFGLPDLYDIQFAFAGDGGSLGGIANYDIMANPRGQSDRLSWPGHLSAWSRWVMGWVEPMEIVDPGSYELRAVQQFSEVFRISKGYAVGEFLLIENRQPIPGDFDERFYQPGGILIYHIDENNLELEGYGNSPAGGPYQEGWPQNGNHYPVALLQRDGLYELEQRINFGHIDDVYIIGSEGLYPGSGQYPNTDSYARGNIRSTGIEIDNFRAGSEPGSILFDVNFQDKTQSPTTDPTITIPTIIETDKPVTAITDAPTQTAPLNPSPEAIETEVPVVPTLFPTLGFTSRPTLNLTTLLPAVSPTQKPTLQPTEVPSERPSLHPVDRPTLPPNLIIIRSGAYTVPTPTIPPGRTPSKSFSGSRSSKSSKSSKKASKSSKRSKAKGKGKGKGKGRRPASNFSDSKKRLQRFSTAGLKKTLGIWDTSSTDERAAS